MNDSEIDDFAEYLPSVLANAARAADRFPQPHSSTLCELKAALGAALAAAMRLRAERRIGGSGVLGPYEQSVLMGVDDSDDEDDSL